MKILITGGGSEEPIDNVRSVCNFSTGKTSSFLADFFASKGAEVTAVMSEKSVKPKNAKIETYRTFAQLKSLLEKECKEGYDAIIHAAAVSDYTPETIIVDGKEFKAGEVSKVPAGTELVIKMKKNPKLVDSLKSLSGKNTKVVAFKLTSNAQIAQRVEAVNKIFNANEDKSFSPDYVVSNDLSEITSTAHPCTIFRTDGTIAASVKDLNELAETLFDLVKVV